MRMNTLYQPVPMKFFERLKIASHSSLSDCLLRCFRHEPRSFLGREKEPFTSGNGEARPWGFEPQTF